MLCRCGHISSHRLQPGRYQVSCPRCSAKFIVGIAFYTPSKRGIAGGRIAPADAAIPSMCAAAAAGLGETDTKADLQTERAASPLVSECSDPFPHAADCGLWRSSEPVTLDIDCDMQSAKRYLDSTGCEWLAKPLAMRTRMLAVKASDYAQGDLSSMQIVSAVEWGKETRLCETAYI